MKIILCTFLLCITAVSVFGQSVPLHGIVGQRVEFSAAVEKGGFLMYGGVTIGDVTNRIFSITLGNVNYRDRLQWDSSTGLFSLSGLKMEDSGEYKVQIPGQNMAVFQLNMHVPVSKPHVRVTRNEYRCTILCTVENGTRATLSWYREGEKESYGSSLVESAPHLYLPLAVERSGTYTCEANNSVSNKKASITVGAHCTAVFGQSVELHGILGQSVTFPAAVKKKGSLMYGTLPIGAVDSGSFMRSRNERFNGIVQWDSSTGFFSLSRLKMEDIGEYEVQNTDQNINIVFQLNVHKDNVPVSKPHVNVTRNEYRCTILCTVDRGTGATLYWYREGEKESYSSSSVHSAPDLDLPVSVESGTYTCEARNSVSRETSDPLTVGAHCTAPSGSNTVTVVLNVLIAVLLVTLIAFIVLYCHNRRKDSIIDDIIRIYQGGCIYDPVRNTITTTTTIHEKMTSSHQTEVPSNQDTEVVEP